MSGSSRFTKPRVAFGGWACFAFTMQMLTFCTIVQLLRRCTCDQHSMRCMLQASPRRFWCHVTAPSSQHWHHHFAMNLAAPILVATQASQQVSVLLSILCHL